MPLLGASKAMPPKGIQYLVSLDIKYDMVLSSKFKGAYQVSLLFSFLLYFIFYYY